MERYQTLLLPGDENELGNLPEQYRPSLFFGCFRCHDGEHVSNAGKIISKAVLSDSARPLKAIRTLPVQHTG
jgi:hypothetical protein